MALSQAFTDALAAEVASYKADKAAAVAVVQSQLDTANATIATLQQSLTDQDTEATAAVQAVTLATPTPTPPA